MKLTVEQVRDAIEVNSWAETCTIREFNDSSWQAIADELNETLDGGECEYVIQDNMSETDGMGDVWFRCTNCNTTYDYYTDDFLMSQNYCPHCGYKIRKAVEQ